MDADIKRRWVEALRSGRYKQGHGRLCTPAPGEEDSFCCLGVLCDVIDPSKWKRSPTKIWAVWRGEADFPPEDMIDREIARALTAMNDHWRLPFDKIADHIETMDLGKLG